MSADIPWLEDVAREEAERAPVEGPREGELQEEEHQEEAWEEETQVEEPQEEEAQLQQPQGQELSRELSTGKLSPGEEQAKDEFTNLPNHPRRTLSFPSLSVDRGLGTPPGPLGSTPPSSLGEGQSAVEPDNHGHTVPESAHQEDIADDDEGEDAGYIVVGNDG
ncbi:hypothetical protein QBC45DRAFT_19792 [Copromyces sp. CBS 386.78]|nr:hypothetical protein QBC45DRAFT_19792 [Copromyces sp. CBS 386.78]